MLDLKKQLEQALHDIQWNFVGILNSKNRLHPIPKNIQIQALFEYLAKERIVPLARSWGSRTTEATTTREYPDLTIEGGQLGDIVVAVDTKTTRRLRPNQVSGFTLGSYGGYFRHPNLKRPGCVRPYGQYSEHWIVGFIYTWNEDADTRHMVSDVELIVQPKWKIAARRTGTGTTTAIGSITQIDRLRAGQGDFTSEREFLRYWRHESRMA